MPFNKRNSLSNCVFRTEGSQAAAASRGTGSPRRGEAGGSGPSAGKGSRSVHGPLRRGPAQRRCSELGHPSALVRSHDAHRARDHRACVAEERGRVKKGRTENQREKCPHAREKIQRPMQRERKLHAHNVLRALELWTPSSR